MPSDNRRHNSPHSQRYTHFEFCAVDFHSFLFFVFFWLARPRVRFFLSLLFGSVWVPTDLSDCQVCANNAFDAAIVPMYYVVVHSLLHDIHFDIVVAFPLSDVGAKTDYHISFRVVLSVFFCLQATCRLHFILSSQRCSRLNLLNVVRAKWLIWQKWNSRSKAKCAQRVSSFQPNRIQF